MRSRAVESVLWLASALAAAAGGLSWRRTSSMLASPAVTAGTPAATAAPSPDPSVDARRSVAVIVTGNVFRRDRRSVEVVSPPTGAAAQPIASPPAPPKPRLLLRGLIGGPPWPAVVEGIPGREQGIVLRAGDTVAGLTVRDVRAAEVIVRGMDTTWTLRLRRP